MNSPKKSLDSDRGSPRFLGCANRRKSPRILPRDGLRLRGKYTVSEQDVLQAREHGPDAVHAWWPIETWDISTGPTYAYPPARPTL